MPANGSGHRIRVYLVAECIVRTDHLQVAPRQQPIRVRDVAGAATELDGELRCTQNGRADALTGRKQLEGQPAVVQPAPDTRTQTASEVSVVARFALVHVLGDATGEHDTGHAVQVVDRLGQVELVEPSRNGSDRDGRHQGVNHRVGDVIKLLGSDDVTKRPGPARALGVRMARWFQARDAAIGVDDLEPATDVQRRGFNDATVVDQCELRCAATNVDVENPAAGLVGCPGGTRPVGGEHGLHVMARSGAHELAGPAGQNAGDALRVAPPRGFAG